MKKVAIITGASSGIGKECALLLQENGYLVYDISKTINPSLNYTHYECDVNDSEKIDKILKEIFDKEGHIDVFVNNAGFGIAGAIENTKEENIKAQINTNLTSVINLCGKIIPYIKVSGGGNIINISSVGGIVALPFQAVYSATKAGVEIFSKALAIEVKPYNIKVTAILPGDTKTGFTQARKIDNGDEESDVQKRMSASVDKMAKDEQRGMSPVKVAKVVLKVLKKKNPPLRKSVGFISKCEVLLVRLLPTKLVNKIVEKIYG